MHEMGIAGSIIEAVDAEAKRHPRARVTKVGMRLGALAGVDRASLEFCFEALVKDTPMDGLALVIEDSSGDELELRFLELEENDGAGTAGKEGPE